MTLSGSYRAKLIRWNRVIRQYCQTPLVHFQIIFQNWKSSGRRILSIISKNTVQCCLILAWGHLFSAQNWHIWPLSNSDTFLFFIFSSLNIYFLIFFYCCCNFSMSQFPGMVRPNYPPGPPGYRPPGMTSHPMYQNRPAASQGKSLKSLRLPMIWSIKT